ncbi:hypothetical protein [Actinomadura rifamycini]|uniref:hypothetical protein n=1 Tax=Actinomadura rifamycini TaxID=31962 RepID=UPI000414A5E8|nr:hypothetical protein [Actinomadura rifamycini]
MDQDFDGIVNDPEAVERHARANIEALRSELEAALRSALAHIGWRGNVLVEDDFRAMDGSARRTFLLSTSTEPPGDADGWEETSVQMPGVPLEAVRAARGGDRWAPCEDGTSTSWDALLAGLTEEAAKWEMFLANILAFLDDVAARGGPRIDPGVLSVDVDAAGGDDVEPYWVPVGGERFTVFMHADVLGRDSAELVGMDADDLPWDEAVDAFVRQAAEHTA